MHVQITTRHGQFEGEILDLEPPEWVQPAGLDIAIHTYDREAGVMMLVWMRKSDIVSIAMPDERVLEEQEDAEPSV